MKQITPLFLITLFILMISNCSSEKIPWADSTLNEAIQLSNDKLIMIDFYADWCSPCQQLDQNTFSDSTVIEYCKNNFINLKINTDTEYGYEVYNEFNVNALPMILFIDSGKHIVGKIEGYYGPLEYLNKIKNINDDFMNPSIISEIKNGL